MLKNTITRILGRAGSSRKTNAHQAWAFAERLENRCLLSTTAGHSVSPDAAVADGIELDINTVTGDVVLNGNDASNVTLVSLSSNDNGLIGSTAFTSAFNTLFTSLASNSRTSIVAFNTTPQLVNGQVDMGNIYDTAANTKDVTLQFSERGVNRGGEQDGNVVYVGGATLTAPVVTGPGTSIAPGSLLSTTTPTFQWNAVTGASGLSGYQINLSDQTAGRTFTYQVGASTTSFTRPSGVLVLGDKYQWNVRALAGSQTGPVSASLYFQAPAAVIKLSAPVQVGPGTVAASGPVLTTLTPAFQWHAVSGVSGLSGYQIGLYNLTTRRSYSYQVGPTATSFTLPTGTLVRGDKYLWDIRLVVGSTYGPFSGYLYFQAPAATKSFPGSNTAQINIDTQALASLGEKQRVTTRALLGANLSTATTQLLEQNLNSIDKQIRVLQRALAVLESET